MLFGWGAGGEARGFDRAPKCTIRFFLESGGSEASPFATPIVLHNPTRQTFIESVASISEKQVLAATCYPAEDGSWGCLLQLNNSGRLALHNISSANRGRTLVVHVGGAKISRMVQEIYIDQAVSDGLVPIPRGLTYAEAKLVQRQFSEIKTARRP